MCRKMYIEKGIHVLLFCNITGTVRVRTSGKPVRVRGMADEMANIMNATLHMNQNYKFNSSHNKMIIQKYN